MTDWLDQIHVGDCRQLLDRMAAEGQQVNMCVTSPPYYGLRDYGVDGQIGLEASLDDWLGAMVEVFDRVREVLTEDGTLWLNLGDSYAGSGRGGQWTGSTLQGGQDHQIQNKAAGRKLRASRRRDRAAQPRSDQRVQGLKPKDLMGQPWRVALALQASGWYLRRDIIWHKPNPMPESAKDRPTTAHEYIFLLSKSERYHYDADAIAEPVTGNAHSRGKGTNPKCAGWADGSTAHTDVAHAQAKQEGAGATKFGKAKPARPRQNESFSAAVAGLVDVRNSRSVWTIPTEPTSFAHFACFPREVPRRCILAGSKPGDIVLDPFMGSGTTAEVAQSLGRRFVGLELSEAYASMFKKHRSQQQGMAI